MEEMNATEREAAIKAVRECGTEEALGTALWNVVELYAGSTFYTSKKLPFTYRVKGRELFCDRKEKSITQATVLRAYRKILEAQKAGEPIRGPKKLSMFGAPYIWGILKGTGLAGEDAGTAETMEHAETAETMEHAENAETAETMDSAEKTEPAGKE